MSGSRPVDGPLGRAGSAGEGGAAEPRARGRTLILGASGFVGSLLLERLADEANASLRALVRDASGFDAHGAEVVEADLQEPESLVPALDGVDVAYYLVHSMDAKGDLAEQDRSAAENYVAAAERAGVRRTIYMGAVGADDDPDSSPHLRSRYEVEQILAGATAELVVVRASMVIGAGSGSFRTLVEMVDRLPALALPPWRKSRSQPIAIDDLLACLVAARSVPPGRYDVVGADELSVEAMMREIARQLDQPYRAVPLPVSVPAVEGAAASLVADEDRGLITALLEGLQDELVVERNDAEPVFGVAPVGFEQAASRAIPEIVGEDERTPQG